MEKQFLFVDVANPTWLVYLAVLVIAVFFRFSRLFTVRNLDLVMVLALSASLVVASEWKSQTKSVPANPYQQTAISPASIEAQQPDSADSNVLLTSADGTLHPSGAESVSLPSAREENAESGKIESDHANDAAAKRDGSVTPEREIAVPAGLNQTEPQHERRSPQFHPVYHWSSAVLLVLSVLLMLRLVFDESMTRRPRLEQNLNQAGLAFLCVPAFALLMVSVFVVEPPNSAMAAVQHGKALLERREAPSGSKAEESLPPAPTETLIAAGAAGVAQLSGQWQPEDARGYAPSEFEKTLAQTLVVIAHTIVVLGLLHIGRRHFGSLQLGLSMSCLYLLLPCTAFNVHQLSHVLPGACLTWAIASYRKPVVSGVLLGLACGTLFFSVFLLPVWAVFYGKRGGLRFALSVIFVGTILAICLMLTSSNTDSFISKVFTTMNWTVYRLLDETGAAPEAPFGQLFVRIPLAAVFFVMLTAMTVLPRARNLENLLANSTALVVAAQMWYPEDIGTYVLWYLPLLLLVVFRPRLDRFTPPDTTDRSQASASPPTTAGAPSSIAMSRLTLYQ
ncbi:MAG: hypothetical protein KDA91_10010 [Planctomycetaceae bacterium]|nr:hypothetical protein [Planctomycetaceae bacterium]